jgi:hypothetical protein
MSAIGYWNGELYARLSSSNVKGAWGNKSLATKFANKVLATWAHDSRGLRRSGPASALKTLEAMGHAMSVGGKLRWSYVRTMWDVCVHLDANKGGWSDADLSYYGGGGAFGGFVDDVPYALACFAERYDENLNALVELIKKQQEAVKGLKKAMNKSSIDWKTINDPLKQFDDYTKAIEPLMVMCPEGKALKGWTYAKTIAKYTGAADDLLAEVRKSGDIKTASAVTALAFIVGECVPVFGSLYAEAIKGLPNAIRFFEDIKADRNLLMAKVYGSQYKMYDH